MSQVNPPASRPTFRLTLGVFVVLGFAQLGAIGIAYTTRAGTVKTVVKYKATPPVVLHKYLERKPKTSPLKELNSNATPEEIINKVLSKEEVQFALAAKSQISSPVLDAGRVDIQSQSSSYTVRDPLVAKLLNQSQKAYKMGDMGSAILKLEEAKTIDPDEPALLFQSATIQEDLGQKEQARELYVQIFSQGYKAGLYYERASKKLKNGVGKQANHEAAMHIGAININRDKNQQSAKITIPIHASEHQEILVDFVEVQVHFYDKENDKKVTKAATNANIVYEWIDQKNVNWLGDKQEVLTVDYSIAPVDAVQKHLFGNRTYYGQVIELYYKGELQDTIAHPSVLHKVHGKASQPEYKRLQPFPPDDPSVPSDDFSSYEDLPPLNMLEDFNPSNPLLPSLPQRQDSDLPNY